MNMERDLLVDSKLMYRLFENSEGAICLGVMTGGIAMYEVTFVLSEAELGEYAARGKSYLDDLSYV
ncbi:MAG: hypothetical protein ACRER5_11735, partial [Pseudomonas sp.]